MKNSELKTFLQNLPDDNEVVVKLHQPGVGGTPTTAVNAVSHGFDWDQGKIIISTKEPIVTEEHLASIQKYRRAFEHLLYIYAMENNIPFQGQPLAGSKMCPKGSAVRAFKDAMKKYVNEYLGNKT